MTAPATLSAEAATGHSRARRRSTTNERRWRFLQRRVITDPRNPDEVYLTRWHLFDTPWCGVKIHHIHRPDPGTALHDHPWSFVAFVLRGGYLEQLTHPDPSFFGARTAAARSWGTAHRMRAEDLHRIIAVRPSTWTLVICGPRRRRWGFETEAGHWVDRDNWAEAPASAA